jgi:pimeloyl-ACP methyl ester carboxylesterase
VKTLIALTLIMVWLAPAVGRAGTIPPGLYSSSSGRVIYVGVENEQPDPAVNQYFDPLTQLVGDLTGTGTLSLRKGVNEERRTVHAPNGTVAASLYYTSTRKRATVILIHGNDAETREMGFIIPYLVLNGVNVISYDQRGTGQSSGNWQLNGPVQRASDVEAIYDAFREDGHVDGKRLGIWGFSNGGWTAPIVAARRPVAFMILKSAPVLSVASNVDYEVTQRMHRDHFSEAAVSAALETVHTVIAALSGRASWNAARRSYATASAQPWFRDSEMPPNLHFPIQGPMADGLRRVLLYDPADALQQVRTPTLALYGARDRNVDVAHASRTLRSDFSHAGMLDFTMHVYQNAGHTLTVSATGFNSQPSLPERLAPGYPAVMIDWLNRRGFLH